jgi:hypothetical protein
VRQKLEARFGTLNWKHYGSAATAALALGIGFNTFTGKTPDAKPVNSSVPAPIEPIGTDKQPVIEPLPAETLPTSGPTPITILTGSQAAAILAPVSRAKSETAVKVNPTPQTAVRYYPTPQATRPQVADNPRPVYQPPANSRPTPTATPQPAPTPQPNKFDRTMDKVGKTAEAAEGIWGIIRKRKN